MLPPPSTLFPRQRTPELTLPLAGGGEFILAETQTDNFHLLVFYRGQHCPVCKTQLKALKSHLTAFTDRGVTVTTISCDSKERAEQMVEDWGLEGLRVAYGWRAVGGSLSLQRAEKRRSG